MSQNTLIKNYSEALYKESKDNIDTIKQELDALVKLFNDNEDLYEAIKSSIVRENIKIKLLHSLFAENKFSHQVQNLLLLLVKNKRFDLFLDIAHNYQNILHSLEKIICAKVTSSKMLDKVQESEVIKMLESKFKAKFSIVTAVNPKILGGLVIEYDSILLDLSLKGQLESIKACSKARLETLQSAL